MEQVAERIGCDVKTAYNAAKAGKFPFAVRLGRTYFISRAAFEEWLRNPSGAARPMQG
jgi:excisionase family DNA binding protein